MESKKYVYWEDGGMWIGYFEDYPDYLTQGASLEELKDNLIDMYKDLTSGDIPHIRKVSVLDIV